MLWSRIGQIRACNCSTCIRHTTTALARRASPTALAASRSRLGDHLLTLGYTATFATAVVLDAHRKKERTDQWDELIRETKGELQETTDKDGMMGEETSREGGPTLAEGKTGVARNFLVSESMQNGKRWDIPPLDHEVSLDYQLELLDHWVEGIVLQSGVVVVRGSHRPILKKIVYSEDTGKSFDYYRQNLERRPSTLVHVERMEDTITRLVAGILFAHKRRESQSSQPKDPTNEERRAELRAQMQANIASLSSAHTQLPSYSLLTFEVTESRLSALNKALTSVFKAADQNGSDITVTQICYNLLISPVPPNITSYNILIMYFLKLGLLDLSQIVIDSFYNDTKLAPDETTIAAILHHHIARNDRNGFYDMTRRMRGLNGNLRIKQRLFSDVIYNECIAHWASTRKVLHRNAHFNQKAPRDQTVFHELVLGECTWGNTQGAVIYTRAMVREGYRLTTDLLKMLTRAIISNKDLKRARDLLRFLYKVWMADQQEKDYAKKIMSVAADARLAIHRLMSFCGIELSHNLQIKQMMNQLWVDKEHTPLHRMARELYLESIEDAVKRAESRTFGLERRLAPHMKGNNIYSSTSVTTQPETKFDKEWAKKSHLNCLRCGIDFLSQKLQAENEKRIQKAYNEIERKQLLDRGHDRFADWDSLRHWVHKKQQRRLRDAEIEESEDSPMS